MGAYCKQYEALKGMRTLDWIPSLGVVKLDLELASGTQSFSVSPTRATVIYHFENQGTEATHVLKIAVPYLDSMLLGCILLF